MYYLNLKTVENVACSSALLVQVAGLANVKIQSQRAGFPLVVYYFLMFYQKTDCICNLEYLY